MISPKLEPAHIARCMIRVVRERWAKDDGRGGGGDGPYEQG